MINYIVCVIRNRSFKFCLESIRDKTNNFIRKETRKIVAILFFVSFTLVPILVPEKKLVNSFIFYELLLFSILIVLVFASIEEVKKMINKIMYKYTSYIIVIISVLFVLTIMFGLKTEAEIKQSFEVALSYLIKGTYITLIGIVVLYFIGQGLVYIE